MARPPAHLPDRERREFKTYCERQITYAVIDHPKEAADASRLLEIARVRWQVENRCFGVADGTFAEDACRVHTGNAPRRPRPYRRLRSHPRPTERPQT